MRANIIILCCFCGLPAIFGTDEKNETTFVPTHEWQTVKKGTPIPAGLHVRHNFETGITEAKLMDPEETDEKKSTESSNHSNSKSIALHPDKPLEESDAEAPVTVKRKPESSHYSLKELMAQLKKIKEDVGTTLELTDEEQEARVKQKFRDYETIKKELKAMDINITTDSEVLSSCFKKFQPHKNGIVMGTLTTSEIERVLEILYNLEFLLHSIDNARVFTDMQGITKIISPCLNATNNEIKANALRLLGVAVQSNPRVQLKALENDFVQKLLHILSTSNKMEVKARCMFALGALIRQFPAAQKVWIDHGGLEIFGKIMVSDQLPVQMKVMKLINDLIIERQNLQEITDLEQREQRIRAYAVADIERKMLVHEYCKHLSNLLVKRYDDEINNNLEMDRYDFLEVITESMIGAAPTCTSVFQNNKEALLSATKHLLQFYKNRPASEDEDENELLQNLMLLIGKLQTIVSEAPHDEL